VAIYQNDTIKQIYIAADWEPLRVKFIY